MRVCVCVCCTSYCVCMCVSMSVCMRAYMRGSVYMWMCVAVSIYVCATEEIIMIVQKLYKAIWSINLVGHPIESQC